MDKEVRMGAIIARAHEVARRVGDNPGTVAAALVAAHELNGLKVVQTAECPVVTKRFTPQGLVEIVARDPFADTIRMRAQA